MVENIVIKGAEQHNLKHVDAVIPRNKLVVITGLSGSGKSSLAFDTLYAEGQRRYVESLSAYARQFLDLMQKPKVEHIDGLSPAIAIEQRTGTGTPRSTVATVTEIYDYLRLLYTHVGLPHCPHCGKPLTTQSAQAITERLLKLKAGLKMTILAPVVSGRKGEHREILEGLRRDGFIRARIDGKTEMLVPSIKVKAVETTGAGDAFNGGLSTAIAEGLPMDVALKFATCTSAISVTRLGSSPSMPYRHEILALLEKEFGITL
jgi:excinuclease ABC subunit A